MPSWVIWLLNIVVVAILAGLAYLLRWIGPEFCAGLIVGFAWCYIAFKCWRFDYEDAPHFIDQSEAEPRQQSRPYSPRSPIEERKPGLPD